MVIPEKFAFIKPALDSLLKIQGEKFCELKMALTEKLEPCDFFDPSAGEEVDYRFSDSEGVDVWTKGQVTLLKKVEPTHATTGGSRSNGRPWQFLR